LVGEALFVNEKGRQRKGGGTDKDKDKTEKKRQTKTKTRIPTGGKPENRKYKKNWPCTKKEHKGGGRGGATSRQVGVKGGKEKENKKHKRGQFDFTSVEPIAAAPANWLLYAMAASELKQREAGKKTTTKKGG
jgi:hypothetical protein